jgi:hypothetical protein
VNGYKFSTDAKGRVVSVEGQLTLAKAERNGYQQTVAGRADRLPGDQGGRPVSMYRGLRTSISTTPEILLARETMMAIYQFSETQI